MFTAVLFTTPAVRADTGEHAEVVRRKEVEKESDGDAGGGLSNLTAFYLCISVEVLGCLCSAFLVITEIEYPAYTSINTNNFLVENHIIISTRKPYEQIFAKYYTLWRRIKNYEKDAGRIC